MLAVPKLHRAIDRKQVVLQALANSRYLFFNYKFTYSLVLLAVVDAYYLFWVVDVGGLVGAATVGLRIW